MSKKMEALQMLNLAFESHDGAPVMQAIITQADYRLLFEALMEKDQNGSATEVSNG